MGCTSPSAEAATGSGGGTVTDNGNDTVTVSGAGTGGGGVVTMGGDDTVTVNGKTGGINLGTGDDTLRLGTDFDTGGLVGGSGNDRLVLTGGKDKWLVEKADNVTYVSVKGKPESRAAAVDFEQVEFE